MFGISVRLEVLSKGAGKGFIESGCLVGGVL